MGKPFIYVGTHTIKEGKLEEFKKMWPEHVDLVETNEPRLIAFHAFLDEAERKVAIVQVHPDSASMQFHMQVISQALQHSIGWLEETESELIYGEPYDGMVELFQSYAPGTPIVVLPLHEGGFTRTNAAR